MKKQKQNSSTLDFAEKWRKVKQNDSECYKALIRMSRISCRPGQANKPFFTNVPAKVLKPAVRADLIIIKDGAASFKGDLSWHYAICEYIYGRVLQKSWKDDKRLWKAMRTIFLLGYQIGHDELAATVIEMAHNIYNMDVVKRVGELCAEQKDCFNLLHAFAETLPKLKVEAKSLKKSLGAIEPTIRNDLAGIEIYDSVERLCELHTDTANTLYQELVSGKKGVLTGFIVSVIKGMAKTDFKQGYAKALSLLESNSTNLVSVGIIALGSLYYSDSSRDKYLQKTLKLYHKMISKRNTIVISSLVKGYGRLLKYTDEPKEQLSKLSETKNPEILYEIAVVLLLNAELRKHETWFEKALLNLAGIDSKYARITNKIDSVLSRISKENADLVMRFWEAWSVCRNYAESEQEKLTVFRISVSSIVRECFEKVREYYTKWLNSDEHKLHLAASDLISECCHHKKRIPSITLELDHNIVQVMSNRDIIYVIFKILGYVSINPEALCNLVFSVIDAGCKDKMVTDYVVVAFRDYIVYNYAGTTIDFLKVRAKSENKFAAKIANKIKKQIEIHHQALKKLTNLRELQPPPRRVHEMEQAKAKHFGKQIYEGAKKQSVFFQFCKEVPLKAGSSFFMERDGKFSGKTELMPISHSMEYPRGEILDPVGQAFSRLEWRNLKRKDLPCS